MHTALPVLTRTITIAMAALALIGCSSGGRSLLALEDEKAEFRAAFAQRIGASRLEVDQALISSAAQERKTADAVTEAMITRVGLSYDAEMADYLQTVADHLAHAVKADYTKFKIVLLGSRQANAFTPGAGTILINEGLLQFADNEAQVAAVMAHEMAHVLMRHPQRQKQIRLASKAGSHFMNDYTPTKLVDNVGRWLRIGGSATMTGLIRQQEMMADSVGIDIMVKAHYDPREMVAILQKLRAFSPQRSRTFNVVHGNHPLTEDREKAAAAKIARTYRNPSGIISSPAFEVLVAPYRQKHEGKLASGQR
jgi:predicted Zn-dependent protease